MNLKTRLNFLIMIYSFHYPVSLNNETITSSISMKTNLTQLVATRWINEKHND